MEYKNYRLVIPAVRRSEVDSYFPEGIEEAIQKLFIASAIYTPSSYLRKEGEEEQEGDLVLNIQVPIDAVNPAPSDADLHITTIIPEAEIKHTADAIRLQHFTKTGRNLIQDDEDIIRNNIPAGLRWIVKKYGVANG